MKMKLHEERSFTLKHTLWYTILYFAVINVVLPIVVVLIATLFDDVTTVDGVVEIPIIYQAMIYGVGLLLFYIVSIGVLRTQWELYKQKFSVNLKTVSILFAVMQVMVIVSNLVISNLMGTTSSDNQSQINEIARYAPTYIVFITLVFAPLVEELLFRGGFYFGFIRAGMSEAKAMLISSIGFGLLHVASSVFVNGQFVLSEILYIIPYAIMGFFFTEAARRTQNIWGAVMLHFMNNLLSILVLFFYNI